MNIPTISISPVPPECQLLTCILPCGGLLLCSSSDTLLRLHRRLETQEPETFLRTLTSDGPPLHSSPICYCSLCVFYCTIHILATAQSSEPTGRDTQTTPTGRVAQLKPNGRDAQTTPTGRDAQTTPNRRMCYCFANNLK